MSEVDRAVEFLEGGSLWDIVSGAVCGECSPPEDCDGCDGPDLISEIENQIAAAGLEFMKRQAQEWVKYSIER